MHIPCYDCSGVKDFLVSILSGDGRMLHTVPIMRSAHKHFEKVVHRLLTECDRMLIAALGK